MRCTAVVCFVAAIAAIPIGCSQGIDAGMAVPDAAEAPPAPDARTMDAIDRQMIREASNVGAFTRINRAPYPSAVGSFEIDVYVNVNRDAHAYSRIHPETTGTGIVLPPGTLIVRQVLDAQGQVAKVTLMAKQAAGYDPTLGDWWFGVTDPAGVPLQDASGPQVGRLVECHGCHLPRAQDDYLFGVPQQVQ